MSRYIYGGHIRGVVVRVDDRIPSTGEPFHHWAIVIYNGDQFVLSDNGYGSAARAIEECSALVWAVRAAWSYGFGQRVRA